jgi:pyruvate,water dikinase
MVKGQPASKGVVTGTLRFIQSPNEVSDFESGDILLADRTTPDYLPIMRRAAAIVTHHGGRLSHAAVVSREFGVPCVVAVTENIRHWDGMEVEVNGGMGTVEQCT